MKVVASTDEYTIYQRRDGRYAVTGADKQPINADAKVEILLKHELIVAPAPKAAEPEEAPAVESAGESPEEGAEEAAEEGAEEAAAETAAETAEAEAPAEEESAAEDTDKE